jgi:molecular chaperone HscB
MHAAGPEKARAEGMSARINEAYRTLLSPLRRAEYILSLQEGGGGGGETDAGADVMGEERVEGEEGGFLAEVLDVRERVEGAESWDEVHELGRENEERVRRCEEDLGRLVEEGRWGEARKEVARLRYWMGIRDVIENWGEDGKGEGRGSGSGT